MLTMNAEEAVAAAMENVRSAAMGAKSKSVDKIKKEAKFQRDRHDEHGSCWDR